MADRRVLDASALLALLLGEPGADRVRAALHEGAFMSAVNLAEVIGRLIRRGMEPRDATEMVLGLPIQSATFTVIACEHMTIMWNIPNEHGLSLADRVCLDLGRRLGLPILTSDKGWSNIPAQQFAVTLEFIR